MPSPTSPIPSPSSKPSISPPPHGLWRWRCKRCKLSLPISTAPLCIHCTPKRSRFPNAIVEFDIAGWARYNRRKRLNEVLEAEKRAEREVARLRKKVVVSSRLEEIDFGFPNPPRENLGLTSNPVRTPLPGRRASPTQLQRMARNRAISKFLDKRRKLRLAYGEEGKSCWEDCDYPGECRYAREIVAEMRKEKEEGRKEEEIGEDSTEDSTEEEEKVKLQGKEGMDWRKEEEITGMEVREWMERERRAKESLMGETKRALGGKD